MRTPESPRVSVLLPVYNAASTVRQAIESILAQDFGDFELIVIDDASSDSSPEIIREYTSADARLRMIAHPRNLGLPSTLNKALQAATGEFVVRMDADDEALPARLRVQVEFMDAHPTVAVAGSFVYHMGARREFDHLVEFPTRPAEVKEMLRLENCIYHPAVIMRRAEMLALGGYRPEFRNAEDYDLWLRTRRVHDLANIPEALLRYRFSVDGQTLARRWEQLFYMYLAQAADDELVGSLREARRAAVDRLAETDHKSFLFYSARATVAELVRLRLWRDAATVLARLRKELGLRAAARVLREIGETDARAFARRRWPRLAAARHRRRLR